MLADELVQVVEERAELPFGGLAIGAAQQLIQRYSPTTNGLNTQLEAAEIVKRAMHIAGEICIYTNTNISILETT